jgi:hypothetical protein
LLEQVSLELQQFTVLMIGEAKKGAPSRFVRDSDGQPEFMDPIASAIAVTLQDPLQAEEDLIWPPAVLNRFGKLKRARHIRADHRSVRPFGLRPSPSSIESWLMAGIFQGAPQPLQIAFRTAGRRKSASDKTNLHSL